MRLSRSSETLGRPSGYRSPFQRDVKKSISALEAAIPPLRSAAAELGGSWAAAIAAIAGPITRIKRPALFPMARTRLPIIIELLQRVQAGLA